MFEKICHKTIFLSAVVLFLSIPLVIFPNEKLVFSFFFFLIILIGLSQGYFDFFVIKKNYASKSAFYLFLYFIIFLISFVFWLNFPAPVFVLFLLLSIYHFGGDWTKQKFFKEFSMEPISLHFPIIFLMVKLMRFFKIYQL